MGEVRLVKLSGKVAKNRQLGTGTKRKGPKIKMLQLKENRGSVTLLQYKVFNQVTFKTSMKEH